MASDQTEMTLYDYLINLRNRGLFQFPAFLDPENNTNPDQDSSERSDPPASDQTEMPQMTLDDYMNDSRNMDLSQNSPITTAFTNSQTNTDPDQDSSERSDPLDRIILINPLTQRVAFIQGSASGINALLHELMTPDGPSPASKASIEAMQSVETKEDDECVICMDEFGGELAKEMPCKHKFHGVCVEKWLKINGSCPVCRYKMPVDEDNEFNHKNLFGEEGGGRRREVWVSISINGISVGTTPGAIYQMATNDSDGPHSEMQGLY